jgi:hypothetical protein
MEWVEMLEKRYRFDIYNFVAAAVRRRISDSGEFPMSTHKKPETAPIASEAEAKPARPVKSPKAIKSPKTIKVAAERVPTPAPVPDLNAAEAVKDDKKKGKHKKEEKKARKKEKKKNKEAVIIRFDDAQLPQIDARAEALGLSRAAWVRMVVATALAG